MRFFTHVLLFASLFMGTVVAQSTHRVTMAGSDGGQSVQFGGLESIDSNGNATLSGTVALRYPNGQVLTRSVSGTPTPGTTLPGRWYRMTITLTPQECDLMGVPQGSRIRFFSTMRGTHASFRCKPDGGPLIFGGGSRTL